MGAGAAIVVEGLTKRFGNFTAVDNVSFEVQRGEIYGFLGPNGAGKTTTIRMVLGLLSPTVGRVMMLGQHVTGNPRHIRPRIGYMAQAFSLYNDLTVRQNLRFYGRAYGIPPRELSRRIDEALSRTDLEGRADTPTRDLSGGWRQRLALNAAILHRPELIFLDEPTAGVDPISRRAFWDLLVRLVSEGITVFVTTHYMDEAEHCHRLALIQRGQIIARGSPTQIKRDEMPGQVLEIEATPAVQAVSALRASGLFGDVALHGARIHAMAPGTAPSEDEVREALRREEVVVTGVATIRPSLEDVFVARMRRVTEDDER
jgi:ABC-2 type transport system ATP-binding protein